MGDGAKQRASALADAELDLQEDMAAIRQGNPRPISLPLTLMPVADTRFSDLPISVLSDPPGCSRHYTRSRRLGVRAIGQ